MATIKDVATLAQVSVATVSRVINKEENVKLETKEKVIKAIKILDYSPNLLGRNLRRSRTKQILVLLPTISNPFYSGVIKGIKSKAQEEGYNIMISITDSEKEIEKNTMKLLTTRLVDGVILFASRLSTTAITKIAKEYPVVQCSEYVEGSHTSRVSIDNLRAAYEAVTYLISLGHTRIAMIGNNEGYTSAVLREQGYKKALEDHLINLNPEFMRYTTYSYVGGQEACRTLLSLEHSPTAIFTIADSIAVGAVKEIKERGLKVGKDIDVIGFDDTTITKIYHPTITTIAQPRFEMGREAMKLILQKIEDIESPSECITLEHRLMIRESTRK